MLKKHLFWQRPIDLCIAIIASLMLFPVAIVICILGYFDTGSPFFVQERVGKNKMPFNLIKFRTLPIDTPSVASHLLENREISRLGSFIRKTKLDELPQLINVIKGEMSLVGPRPCLFNQIEVISEREALGVLDYTPGITGLAQINGIDMSVPATLARTDSKMLVQMTVVKYFGYLIKTALGKGGGDAASIGAKLK